MVLCVCSQVLHQPVFRSRIICPTDFFLVGVVGGSGGSVREQRWHLELDDQALRLWYASAVGLWTSILLLGTGSIR